MGAEHKAGSKIRSGGSLWLLKWLAIVALLILILLALFLPDRGLAWSAARLLSDAHSGPAVPTRYAPEDQRPNR